MSFWHSTTRLRQTHAGGDNTINGITTLPMRVSVRTRLDSSFFWGEPHNPPRSAAGRRFRITRTVPLVVNRFGSARITSKSSSLP